MRAQRIYEESGFESSSAKRPCLGAALDRQGKPRDKFLLAAKGQLAGEHFRRSEAQGHGEIVQDCHADQALDIGRVGVASQRVDEEDQHVQLAARNHRAHLLVPAKGPTQLRFEAMSRRFGVPEPGRGGGRSTGAAILLGVGGSESKRRDAETARRLFVVVLLVYGLFYSGQFTSSDEVAIFQMARSLVEDGDLGVPPLMHTGIGADGVTRHSFFAVGQSVIAVPFVVLAKHAGVALPESWLTAMAGPTMGPGPNTLYSGSYEIFITGLYGPVMTALLISFYFWFQRQLGASPRSALIAALALAFGSYLFQLSSYFLRHLSLIHI